MIQFKHVTKIYPPNITALNDINIHIYPKEFVSIVGRSGAGKSSVLKLLIAQERVTKGKVIVGDWDITYIKRRDIPILRRQIGMVFQDFQLLNKKTVYENVSFALEACGATFSRVKKVVPQVLKIVGLSNKADRYPFELSGGEKQRVAIARALVHRPKILLADEPTGNLDSINTAEIIELLLKINEFGTTVVLVTHNREVVNGLKKRVLVVEDGRVISDTEGGKYSL